MAEIVLPEKIGREGKYTRGGRVFCKKKNLL
jgi:hypothetical protein